MDSVLQRDVKLAQDLHGVLKNQKRIFADFMEQLIVHHHPLQKGELLFIPKGTAVKKGRIKNLQSATIYNSMHIEVVSRWVLTTKEGNISFHVSGYSTLESMQEEPRVLFTVPVEK